MSYISRQAIHPLTWPAIQTEGNIYTVEGGYACGCRPNPSRPHESFHLCDYHDGYDDGLWAADAVIPTGDWVSPAVVYVPGKAKVTGVGELIEPSPPAVSTEEGLAMVTRVIRTARKRAGHAEDT